MKGTRSKHRLSVYAVTSYPGSYLRSQISTKLFILYYFIGLLPQLSLLHIKHTFSYYSFLSHFAICYWYTFLQIRLTKPILVIPWQPTIDVPNPWYCFCCAELIVFHEKTANEGTSTSKTSYNTTRKYWVVESPQPTLKRTTFLQPATQHWEFQKKLCCTYLLGHSYYKIDPGLLWESVQTRLDRSQFAFERSHSDRFWLRSISDS